MRRWTFAILLPAVLGLTSCGGSLETKTVPSSPGSQPGPAEFLVPSDAEGLRTAVVRREALPDYLDVSGRIQADPTRVVRVFPPVGGRLISLDVRPGDTVRKGQRLALLESPDLVSARADYAKARADTARAFRLAQ